MHARALRVLLEKLDDMAKSRADLVARVKRLAASDDITPRILKAASGMEQWVNVQPAMFEDILDEELSKFDKFRAQLEEDARKQEDILKAVQVRASSLVRMLFFTESMTTSDGTGAPLGICAIAAGRRSRQGARTCPAVP